MPSSCSEETVEHLEILNIYTQLSTLYCTNATTLMCLVYHDLFFHMGRQACMVYRTRIRFLSHISAISVGYIILVGIRPFIRLGVSEPGA